MREKENACRKHNNAVSNLLKSKVLVDVYRYGHAPPGMQARFSGLNRKAGPNEG